MNRVLIYASGCWPCTFTPPWQKENLGEFADGGGNVPPAVGLYIGFPSAVERSVMEKLWNGGIGLLLFQLFFARHLLQRLRCNAGASFLPRVFYRSLIRLPPFFLLRLIVFVDIPRSLTTGLSV